MGDIAINVKVNGGIFKGGAQKAVQAALYQEAIEKIDQRLMRKGTQGSGGRGKGVMRNIVTHDPKPALLETTVSSTMGGKAHWPRTKGTAWQKKNVAIVKSMAPRVLRKAADRVVAEMGA